MSDQRLETLLERLNRGDAAAAEEVFLAYEPYLRMVVRRQISAPLRAKFDSMDIVQSVWADVLQGFREAGWRFPSTDHLRAFLIKVTHHRFIDRLRQHRNSLEHDQPLTGADFEGLPPAREPRPSEVVQADDLWQQIMTLCPPAHRELLRLKRQGLSLADIAARVGLHEGSVRRILYGLAQRLVAREETRADDGGATSWDGARAGFSDAGRHGPSVENRNH